MIKSLNKAYQTNSLYYWCNAVGEVNYPGSGSATGDSERLPAAVKELYEHYQFSHGYDANLYTVTYSGEDGMLLTMMVNMDVKNSKQKVREAFRNIAAELAQQSYPWGTVLFGEDTDPEGDEMALFIPAEECATHFEEAVKLFKASTFFERIEAEADAAVIQAVDTKENENANMRKLNVAVQCMAVYNSSIMVPEELTLDEAIKYAKAHIDEINVTEMSYVSDSDVLDEEFCAFDDESEDN